LGWWPVKSASYAFAPNWQKHTQQLVVLYNHMHSWDLIAPNGCFPSGRHGHTMVSHKNKLYMFGGHNGMTTTNELHVYDLVKNSWVEVDTSGIPPSPRFSHSAAVVNGKMYL
jgi:hypothetical protein